MNSDRYQCARKKARIAISRRGKEKTWEGNMKPGAAPLKFAGRRGATQERYAITPQSG
ncbi:hypothetical protein GCM10022406_08370 [Hymenobacter algoricola]|uniref:Uncharacterized protein n=1 Tax=Hymenobacter algoricola TaxID=486267 RepID=A0ABP7MJA3_9BACT